MCLAKKVVEAARNLVRCFWGTCGIDTVGSFHHDALMRTTVDLPDNLHRIALGLARHTGRSLSQAVAEMMQRGLSAQPSEVTQQPFTINEATGLPVARSRRLITADDVMAVEDAA